MKKFAYNQFIDLYHDELRYAVKTTSNTNPLAYSYLRFSSPEQADGDSVRRQTDLRDAWLKRHPAIRLDKSLRLVDAGVSGYTGKNRKNARHALAQFLDLVERGRVLAGSYLIVENLDRLTRENPVVSIPAVLSLIAAGVRVVQLTPSEIVYDADMEQHHLLNMLWELARGHGESKRKSGLCGEAWQHKKAQARAQKTPHGSMCPGWLELVGVKSRKNHRGSYRKDFSEASYRLRLDRAGTVQRIFEWCAEGLGTHLILARLHAEGIPPFGSGKKWGRSSIAKLLNNRAVLGEYQPRKGRSSGERPDDGAPIAGYYPAAIDEALWHAARAAMRAREHRSGAPATQTVNPFSGLLFDARDGSKIHVATNGTKYKYLVSSAAWHKVEGAVWKAFPLATFTEAVLSQLQELSASSLFADPSAERITVLDGRLGDVEKRLAVAQAKFDADPESPSWADMITKYDREKRALVRELNEARLEAAHPLSASWVEAVELMSKDEPRRLRAALLETIESIWCLIVARGTTRLCVVQVWFSKTDEHRDYLIVHRAGMGGAVGNRPPQAWVDSFAEAGTPADLDLRKPADTRKLERYLAAEDLDKLRNAMKELPLVKADA
jgi:DNA invertase Pin-like site-specific DNA recombinase